MAPLSVLSVGASRVLLALRGGFFFPGLVPLGPDLWPSPPLCSLTSDGTGVIGLDWAVWSLFPTIRPGFFFLSYASSRWRFYVSFIVLLFCLNGFYLALFHEPSLLRLYFMRRVMTAKFHCEHLWCHAFK